MDRLELRLLGKEKFGRFCRMCPICDGKACFGEIPGMGGVGSGASFQNNITDLKKVLLRQRIIHDVSEPSTSFELWGHQMNLPVLAAPIAGIAFNLNGFTTDAEFAEAIVVGARNGGGMGMTGDGKDRSIYPSGLQAISMAQGWGIPTIKPRPNEEIIALAEQAYTSGVAAIAIDVDAAALINITVSGQPVGPKTYSDLVELKRNIKVPLIIKGIMEVEDAETCADAGIDGIVVSNHGGRVLDHTPGTARVLPAIAAKVGGDKMKIFVDGGVRSGVDVLKMLALGADAVLMGRPMAQAVAGGASGVAWYFQYIQAQLEAAMIMTGCLNIDEITSDIIYGA